MAEVLKKFGRYFLLDHIAQGGMAEIYRARLAEPDGAGRLLVIKRVQASFGTNTEFLQMFRSEIKVTMGFNHPNVVQVYDFGEEEKQPYIAMEFVDGKNLRQFMTKFAELKQTFPVDLAAHIIAQSASGLSYAHGFKDKISGQPLNVVHRDISPQNILISYEGQVKVIDFGIAKAANNSEATRAGVIKGKPSYLSPEQISGEVLDGRSDLFSLGIVLWELLVGRKLFPGENDLAVLKLIESCQTHVKPPSQFNSAVPKELDLITLKALSKQREKRYQTGEEMQRALHKFLQQFKNDFDPMDLSHCAKDLFKDDIVEDRKRIQKLNEKAEGLLEMVEMSKTPIGDSPAPKPREDNTMVEAPKASGAREFKVNPTKNKESQLQVEVAKPTPARQKISSYSSYTGERMAAQAPLQKSAQKSSSGKKSGGIGKMLLPIAAGLVGLYLYGPELGINTSALLGTGSGNGGGARQPSSATVLELTGSPQSANVLINGQPRANEIPTRITGVPGGRTLHVVVNTTAGSFQQDVVVKEGTTKSLNVVVVPSNSTAPLKSSESIALKLNIIPNASDAVVTLNGKTINPSTPVSVPLDTTLDLTVEKQGYQPFESVFVVADTDVHGLTSTTKDVELEPKQFGTVTIKTTPSSTATTLIGGREWKRSTPFENVKFPVGEYTFKLVNDFLNEEKSVTVSVRDGKNITINENLSPK